MLTAWGRQHYATFPWRAERDPFFALLAEVLLQRTRAAQVGPVYRDLKARFPTPAGMAASNKAAILQSIRSLGLAWRAATLLKLARALEESHGGRVPDGPAALRSLPGVGPYAAAAYESFHRGRRAAIIDSNVVRLYGRLFGFPTHAETRRTKAMRELAEELTPRRAFRDYNYALLDFTREVCTPRPHCGACPLRGRCCYYAGRGETPAKAAGRRGARQ